MAETKMNLLDKVQSIMLDKNKSLLTKTKKAAVMSIPIITTAAGTGLTYLATGSMDNQNARSAIIFVAECASYLTPLVVFGYNVGNPRPSRA